MACSVPLARDSNVVPSVRYSDCASAVGPAMEPPVNVCRLVESTLTEPALQCSSYSPLPMRR